MRLRKARFNLPGGRYVDADVPSGLAPGDAVNIEGARYLVKEIRNPEWDAGSPENRATSIDLVDPR